MFLVDRQSIQETNNQNFGNVDDPEINTMLDEAEPEADIDEAARRRTPRSTSCSSRRRTSPRTATASSRTSCSERMDFENCTVTHPVYQLDFTQLCLK